MPRRNFRAAVVVLAILALSGSAAQATAAASGGSAPSVSLARIASPGLVPYPLRSWLDGTASPRAAGTADARQVQRRGSIRTASPAREGGGS